MLTVRKFLFLICIPISLFATVVSEEEGELVVKEKIEPEVATEVAIRDTIYFNEPESEEEFSLRGTKVPEGGFFYHGVSSIFGTAMHNPYSSRSNHSPFLAFALEYLNPKWKKVTVGGVLGMKLFIHRSKSNMRMIQFLFRTSWYLRRDIIREQRLYLDLGITRDSDEFELLEVESDNLDYIHHAEFESYSRFTDVTSGIGFVHSKYYRKDRSIGLYGEVQYLYRLNELQKYTYAKWPIHLFTLTGGICFGF